MQPLAKPEEHFVSLALSSSAKYKTLFLLVENTFHMQKGTLGSNLLTWFRCDSKLMLKLALCE